MVMLTRRNNNVLLMLIIVLSVTNMSLSTDPNHEMSCRAQEQDENQQNGRKLMSAMAARRVVVRIGIVNATILSNHHP
jgi:hypothetical protein